jgi:hypothetical protein
MNSRISDFLRLALACVVTASAVAGCGSKNGAGAAPSVEQTKAIAEEGFIYGLPIVMNYAVMYEYAVDTKSSQFKAPFNEINNCTTSPLTKTRRSSPRTVTHLIRYCG